MRIFFVLIWFLCVIAFVLLPSNRVDLDTIEIGLIVLALIVVMTMLIGGRKLRFITKGRNLAVRSMCVVGIAFYVVFVPLVGVLQVGDEKFIFDFWSDGFLVVQLLVASLGFLVLWRDDAEWVGQMSTKSRIFHDEGEDFFTFSQILLLALALFLAINFLAVFASSHLELKIVAKIAGGNILYYLTTYVFCWVMALTISHHFQTRADSQHFEELSEIYSNLRKRNLAFEQEAQEMLNTVNDRFGSRTRSRPVDMVMSSLSLKRDAASSEAVFGVASRSNWSEGAAQARLDFGQVLIGVVPMLGFLGTVLGLSDAIGNIADAFDKRSTEIEESLEALTKNILESLGGLSFAFETTIIALAYTVILTIIYGLVSKRQTELNGDIFLLCEKFSWRHGD